MATYTLNKQGRLVLDVGKAGFPHTVMFPNSGLSQEGSKVGIVIKNGGASTVTLTANTLSASDKIMNPLNPFAATQSTWSGLNLSTIVYIEYVLVKTGEVNNTWRLLIPYL